MAESNRRGSTTSQSSDRSTRPEYTSPSGGLSRHNSGLNEATANASRAPASVKVQISDLTDVRYVGIITATHDTWERRLVISIAAKADRDKEVTSDLFLAGSTMRTGQHVYLGRCQLDGCLHIQQYFTSDSGPATLLALKRQVSGLRRNSVDKTPSGSAESQSGGSPNERYIGVISARHQASIYVSPPKPALGFFARPDQFEDACFLEIGLHVYQRLDNDGKYFTRGDGPAGPAALKRQESGLRRTSISETPALTYVGRIDAQYIFWTGEVSVRVRPSKPEKPFILKSERFEGGVKLAIGLHVYELPDSKYVTRFTGPQ